MEHCDTDLTFEVLEEIFFKKIGIEKTCLLLKRNIERYAEEFHSKRDRGLIQHPQQEDTMESVLTYAYHKMSLKYAKILQREANALSKDIDDNRCLLEDIFKVAWDTNLAEDKIAIDVREAYSRFISYKDVGVGKVA